jgi:hypothetical protein
LARLRRMPHLRQGIHPAGPGHYGVAERGIIALVRPDRLRPILSRILDENEFLSPYGIRALSRYHAEPPYVVRVHGEEFRVGYLPAESLCDLGTCSITKRLPRAPVAHSLRVGLFLS